MASSVKIRVKADFPGLTRLIAKVGDNALMAAPWREVIEEGARDLENRVRERVPTGETGVLASTVVRYVDPRPLPTVAMITADAVGNGGFRYGWALQASRRIAYIYRHGPRTGRPTRKWMTGAMRGFRKALNVKLRDAALKIEANWRR